MIKNEEFINRVRQFHGDKYDLSKVEYKNNKTNIVLICPEHGEFFIRPDHIKRGCPLCNRTNCGSHPTTNREEFIAKANKVHNNKYSYNKTIYTNRQTKVCIVCPIHGEFWQTPHKHLYGQGCPKCGKINSQNAKYNTIEQFVTKAKLTHKIQYDFSKVNLHHPDKNGKITIICPYHGEFKMLPGNFLNGQNCPKCTGNHKYTEQEIKNKIRKVHNDKYSLDNLNYTSVINPITLKCKIHGEFKTYISNIVRRGDGCPLCKESHLERSCKDFFEKHKIKYVPKVTKTVFKWLDRQHLDFYLPDYNVAIECQGIQHFETVKIFGGEKTFLENIKRDIKKYKKCCDNKITLIYYCEKKDFIKNNMNEIYTKDNVFFNLENINNFLITIKNGKNKL